MSLGSAAILIGAAYLVTGFAYVRHKLSGTNYQRVPPSVLSWPVATFINSEFSYWMIFLILGGGALYLSSI
jgi:hypothetical protein